MMVYTNMNNSENSFNNRFNQLQNYISEKYSVEDYSEKFFSSKENYKKVGMAYSLLLESNLLCDFNNNPPKSAKESLFFREKGNKEFLLKKDLLAIQTYSVSAAFAPLDSEELALAFANRSAVTYSIKEYANCIEDITRALNGKYPDHLCYKLYERKGKCLKSLGMNKLANECFQKAINCLPTSQLSCEKLNSIKDSLSSQMESHCSSINPKEANKMCLPFISLSKNDVILSASSLIKIEYSSELGRHLVATSDIEPGEVLVIEEPFASILLPSSYNNFCFHCKKRCHSLIPCPTCVVVMYCGEECRAVSWERDHRVECALLPLLLALDFTKIELIALRTLLAASKQNQSLQQLLDTAPELDSQTDPTSWGLNADGRYSSTDYRTVHHLVGNQSLRSNADVFRRAVTAAFILHLLNKHTDYFTSAGDCVVADKVICESNDFGLDDVKLYVGGLLFSYLMIVPSNAHEISEMFFNKAGKEVKCESEEIGGALYPVLSLINHSCDPNVVRHSHNGDTVVLTAIQSIPAGYQIFDNYGYHHAMHDVGTRQTNLLAQYHFTCQCVACQDDWPLYEDLPSSNPLYLCPRLKDDAEKSSEIFQEVLGVIQSGRMEGKLPFLYAHLSLLQRAVGRPWREYSACQEAIKQCLSSQANHYWAP